MQVSVPREVRSGETRVAATPDTVRRFVDRGARVVVEAGAGMDAAIADDAYREAGAEVADGAAAALEGADLVLKVAPPLAGKDDDEVGRIPEGAVLAGFLDPHGDPAPLRRLAERGVTAFAMELVPRISRAQSMDALSSQSNLAGYKAVVDAASALGKAMPMMMTAAGTVAPARVLVLGAGVAGLQAVATAKRLGAVVSAFDVRPAVREQVESLGGRFIEVAPEEGGEAETEGGYAREMGEDYRRRQQELIAETAREQDVIVTTALVPGKPAPVLLPEELVATLRPGTVIVDLAVAAGGNCPLSVAGRTVEVDGVRIIGPENLPGTLARDASALYARNLLAFAEPLIGEGGAIEVPWDDEVFAACVVTRDGALVRETEGTDDG